MKRRLILVGDPNPHFLTQSEEILSSAGYRVQPFADGMEAQELLRQEDPAGVLAYVELPFLDGVQLCRYIKTDVDDTLPVILMSPNDHPALPLCQQVGADNVLIRPIKREELIFAARSLVRLREVGMLSQPALSAQDGSEQEAQGTGDSNTPFGFEFFKAFLAVEIKRARRYGFPLSVMLVALDDLEPLRQRYGKQVLERLLAGLARVVQRTVRDIDIPVTLRDDTILVVMPHTDRTGAQTVAERIRRRIRRSVYHDEPILIHPTISIGETTYVQNKDRNFSQVVRRASHAMDQAIRQGGDQVVVL